MNKVIESLTGDFVLLDLGSANSAALFKPFPELARAATVIRVDARPTGDAAQHPFYKLINLNKGVAGTAGVRKFYARQFPECSSFLQPKNELVEAYGMERYFRIEKVLDIECATVPELLAENGVERVDFFKTDLEGLDFEVIQSSSEIVMKALFVQMELRFQPFYEGEAYFHEAVALLDALGFELVCIRPTVWKYQTPSRDFVRDGRTVWTDALFVLRAGSVNERFSRDVWKPFLKQILLSHALGLSNYAEFIFLKARETLPADVGEELDSMFNRSRTWTRRAIAGLAKYRPGRLGLGACRRICGKGYTLSAVYGDEVIGINPPF